MRGADRPTPPSGTRPAGMVGGHIRHPLLGSNRINDIPVQVLVNDTWLEGWLDSDDWRQDGDRWVATVRYQSQASRNAIGIFDQDDVRKLPGVRSTTVARRAWVTWWTGSA
jgi:hypothetical protein